jgi:hypothetical protein
MNYMLTVCLTSLLCYDIFSLTKDELNAHCKNETKLPNLIDALQLSEIADPKRWTFPIEEKKSNSNLICSIDHSRKVFKFVVIDSPRKFTHLICTSHNTTVSQHHLEAIIPFVGIPLIALCFTVIAFAYNKYKHCRTIINKENKTPDIEL